jgi:hypothetical protein
MIATDTISLRIKLGGAITTANSPITGHYVTMSSAGVVIGVQAIHSITNGTTPVIITPNSLTGYVNVLKNLQVSNADSVTTTLSLDQWDGTTARTIASGALSVGQVITVNSDGTIGIIGGTGSISGAEMLVNKDASSGYAGLTLFGINTKNDAGTVTSTLKNNNNTTQVYTLPNKTGTVALTSDIPTSIESTSYTFDSSTTDSDPGSGDFRFNASTRAAATFIYINKLTSRNNDISEGIKAIVANDTVYIQDANNAGQAVRYKFTTTPVTSGNYFKLAVAIDVAPTGAELTNNSDILLVFRLSAWGGSGNSGTVTQVQGNGTVNGLSLSGNVTTSGNITLGGTLSGTAPALTAGNVTNIPALSGAITGNATGVTVLTPSGFSSVNLANALTNKTGTGLNVFDTNATLNTPNLTTPSFANLTNAIGLPAAGLTSAAIIAILDANNPIGTLREFNVSTNPATLLGFGTWAAHGTGRVTVAIDTSQTEFDVLGETGGEKTHLLTGAESGVPAHVHRVPISSSGGGSQSGILATSIVTGASGGWINTLSETAVNAASVHNNLQPYVVVYRWVRTA